MKIDKLPLGSFIAGGWRTSGDGFAIQDPYSGEIIANVSRCFQSDYEDAIVSANRGLKVLDALAPKGRSEALLAWADALEANSEDLARLITKEQGKPIKESRGEVAYGIDYIRWFSGEAIRHYGQIVPLDNHHQHRVEHRPVGIVGAITPWNFPFAMFARKLSAAFAAGCSVILKPSEETPLTAIAVTQWLLESGFPADAIQLCITDDAESFGEWVTREPAIAKLTFTGSTHVGRWLNERAAGQFKRMSLELGGDAPFLVFSDADIDAAVAGLVGSKLRNAGQTCISVNRIIVQQSVSEEFVSKLISELAIKSSGSGSDETTEVGPLINRKAVLRIEQHVNHAIASGAELLFQEERTASNNHYPITVLQLPPNNVGQHEALLKSVGEWFGPVFMIQTFETEAESFVMANQSQHGLAAYAFTNDYQRIERIRSTIQTGMIGINETAISNAAVPFGGIKCSGFGREGSSEGLKDYSYTQYTNVRV